MSEDEAALEVDEGSPKQGRSRRRSGPSVKITGPKTVEVRLVDVNALGEYEVWTWLATGCLSVAVWFATAWSSAEGEGTGYMVGTLALGTVTLVCGVRAGWRRSVMMKGVTRQTLVEYGDEMVEGAVER